MTIGSPCFVLRLPFRPALFGGLLEAVAGLGERPHHGQRNESEQEHADHEHDPNIREDR